ncbi:MAG: hypothetical protein ACT4P8_02240 [Betaproteobacteria bacterium]
MIRRLARSLLGETALGVLDYYRFPELRHSWGGPFNGQEFRARIFLELIARIEFSAIVETGAYRGTTTEYLWSTSRLPVYSVEKYGRSYGYVRRRFLSNREIRVTHGDSRAFLPDIFRRYARMGEQWFFYLDAHSEDASPLKEEVDIIFAGPCKAVVMVDDFKVPGDPDYEFNDDGAGRDLGLEHLDRPDLAAFFPALSGKCESGERRGCVVLAKADDLAGKLRHFDTLRS